MLHQMKRGTLDPTKSKPAMDLVQKFDTDFSRFAERWSDVDTAFWDGLTGAAVDSLANAAVAVEQVEYASTASSPDSSPSSSPSEEIVKAPSLLETNENVYRAHENIWEFLTPEIIQSLPPLGDHQRFVDEPRVAKSSLLEESGIFSTDHPYELDSPAVEKLSSEEKDVLKTNRKIDFAEAQIGYAKKWLNKAIEDKDEKLKRTRQEQLQYRANITLDLHQSQLKHVYKTMKKIEADDLANQVREGINYLESRRLFEALQEDQKFQVMVEYIAQKNRATLEKTMVQVLSSLVIIALEEAYPGGGNFTADRMVFDYNNEDVFEQVLTTTDVSPGDILNSRLYYFMNAMIEQVDSKLSGFNQKMVQVIRSAPEKPDFAPARAWFYEVVNEYQRKSSKAWTSAKKAEDAKRRAAVRDPGAVVQPEAIGTVKGFPNSFDFEKYLGLYRMMCPLDTADQKLKSWCANAENTLITLTSLSWSVGLLTQQHDEVAKLESPPLWQKAGEVEKNTTASSRELKEYENVYNGVIDVINGIYKMLLEKLDGIQQASHNLRKELVKPSCSQQSTCSSCLDSKGFIFKFGGWEKGSVSKWVETDCVWLAAEQENDLIPRCHHATKFHKLGSVKKNFHMKKEQCPAASTSDHNEMTTPEKQLKYVTLGLNSIQFANCHQRKKPFPEFNWMKCKLDMLNFLNLLRTTCTEPPNSDHEICRNSFNRIIKYCNKPYILRKDNSNDAVVASKEGDVSKEGEQTTDESTSTKPGSSKPSGGGICSTVMELHRITVEARKKHQTETQLCMLSRSVVNGHQENLSDETKEASKAVKRKKLIVSVIGEVVKQGGLLASSVLFMDGSAPDVADGSGLARIGANAVSDMATKIINGAIDKKLALETLNRQYRSMLLANFEPMYINDDPNAGQTDVSPMGNADACYPSAVSVLRKLVFSTISPLDAKFKQAQAVSELFIKQISDADENVLQAEQVFWQTMSDSVSGAVTYIGSMQATLRNDAMGVQPASAEPEPESSL